MLQRAENGDKIHFVVNFANLIVETFANCKWHRQCRDSIFSRGGAARQARETAGRRPAATPPISTCYFLHNHNIEHLPFTLLTSRLLSLSGRNVHTYTYIDTLCYHHIWFLVAIIDKKEVFFYMHMYPFHF